MSQVLDYSLARPDIAQIVARGYVGVMRYVAPIPVSPPVFGGADDSAKVITQAEYDALRSAGLAVGLNWEWYDNRAREGTTAGTADAREALRQAQTLGYNTGAIYFSVDYDAPEGDQPAINAYFQACAQVIGQARLGAYGGYWPLSRLFNADLITYGWQTLAWSGTNRDGRASLFQTGATDFNGEADINDVFNDNWAGEAPPVPPVNYKEQQAAATWGTTYPNNTGIHSAWLDAYLNHSIIGGPPIGWEFGTVDWLGAPIRIQYFANIRIEYYVSTGENHGYTETTKLW